MLADIQGITEDIKSKTSPLINRIKFLNKFYLYSGFSKNMDNAKGFDITKNECIDALTCDHKWQVCLFDFSYKNRVPEFFVFRTSNFLIIDDYFKSVDSDRITLFN